MMLKKETIAITGGTGFIGQSLIPKLLHLGYTIKVLSRKKEHSTQRGVQIVIGDLVTGKGINEFLSGCSVLIHLAARQLPPEELMFTDNVLATNNLIEAALHFPISHVIYLSTVVVYGDSNKIVSEVDSCHPNTTYGYTKYLAENIINYWGTRTKNPTTILRPFNVYGPNSEKGVISNFYNAIKKSNTVVINGNGRQKRNFLYVDDLTDAIVKGVSKRHNGILNLGSENTYSLLELIKIMEDVTKGKIDKNFISKDPEKTKGVMYNHTKAKKILTWKEKNSLQDGLLQTWNWYNQKKAQ